jgi:hypothetical protein
MSHLDEPHTHTRQATHVMHVRMLSTDVTHACEAHARRHVAARSRARMHEGAHGARARLHTSIRLACAEHLDPW